MGRGISRLGRALLSRPLRRAQVTLGGPDLIDESHLPWDSQNPSAALFGGS